MRVTSLLVSIFVGALTGCGGGGGGSDPTPPPPPSNQTLSITLAGTGSMPAFFSSDVPLGFRQMNSLAEFDALYFGLAGPNKPLELRALDFTRFSVIYVEGPADDFPGAAVRLVEIRRTGGTVDTVIGERCTNDLAAIPTPTRAHRPYAFYIVPKLSASTTYVWSIAVSPCATVTPVNFTRVAVGDIMVGSGLPQPNHESKPIRSQAEWSALLPSFPPGAVAPQYLTPDFSQVTLLYVRAYGDWDQNSYVRIFRINENTDGSIDVVAEYCGYSGGGVAFHAAHAVYAVPAFGEAVRFAFLEHEPGSCVLSR